MNVTKITYEKVNTKKVVPITRITNRAININKISSIISNIFLKCLTTLFPIKLFSNLLSLLDTSKDGIYQFAY